MRTAGVVLAIAGAALAIRSALLLAGRGRPRRGIRPAFVIAGPYLRLRNPLYAGIVLAVVGVAAARASVVIALGAVAAAGVAHVWVVRVEEPRLRARFGTAYAEYERAIPRWVPKTR